MKNLTYNLTHLLNELATFEAVMNEKYGKVNVSMA